MKIQTRSRLLALLIFFAATPLLPAQNIKLLTWNIQDLGRTKDNTEIRAIAEIINGYDIAAIQEVVAKDPAGAQAVARIADELNRMGNRWDYRVSVPTKSPSAYSSERYAFLWKSSKLTLLGQPYLDSQLENYCTREPYIGKFKLKNGDPLFYVVNFHSRKHNDHPEEEIRYFDQYQKRLGTDYVIIAGDFNLDEKHEVWDNLEDMGYAPSIRNSPTTLKRKCANGEYLNYAIDNIFFDRDVVKKLSAGRVDFVRECAALGKARGISDHLPVYLYWEIR